MIELEKINKRLEEIPLQINNIIAEKNQLLVYRQALEDTIKKEEPKEKVKKIKNES